MTKSAQAAAKRRGRPPTGRDPTVTARVAQETIEAVEAWADENGITRSTAIGLLLEAGLKRPPKVKAKRELSDA
jgi:hypothetical protein